MYHSVFFWEVREGGRFLSSFCHTEESSFFFLQLTWLFHVDGMGDASPANGVRGDVSGLHMFAGLEGTDGPSKCAWFCRRTGPMKCHGVGVFFFFHRH